MASTDTQIQIQSNWLLCIMYADQNIPAHRTLCLPARGQTHVGPKDKGRSSEAWLSGSQVGQTTSVYWGPATGEGFAQGLGEQWSPTLSLPPL